MKKYFIGSASVLALPVMALAQYQAQNVGDVFSSIQSILKTLIGLFIAIAGVVFIWALVKYISKAGEETERETARNQMIWGVVIIAVMVSVWGLVNLITNSVNLDVNAPTPPELPSIQR